MQILFHMSIYERPVLRGNTQLCAQEVVFLTLIQSEQCGLIYQSQISERLEFQIFVISSQIKNSDTFVEYT